MLIWFIISTKDQAYPSQASCVIWAWSKRLWYRHPLGFGRKASSQLFEGVFQSEITRGGGRVVEEGERESPDAQENDIITATTTTRSIY